jgi:tetratricopeptide (TPR) repeat protein
MCGIIGTVFVAEAFGSWLLGQFASAAQKWFGVRLLGSEQERALRQAATAAIQSTASERRPDSAEDAEELAMVLDQVFGEPAGATPLADHATLLEALQAGVAEQLTVLGDVSVTGTGRSSADLLEIPVPWLVERLTSHLLQEIVARGAGGGPLAPLANQLNHDATHIQNQWTHGSIRQTQASVELLSQDVRAALARMELQASAAGSALARVAGPAAKISGRSTELPTLGVIQAGSAALSDFLRKESARPLVGRDQERTQLARFAGGILAGQSDQLLLAGAAGVGKTRLVGELWQLAQGQGLRVVALACPEPEVRVGLDPWRALAAVLLTEINAGSSNDLAVTHDPLATLLNDSRTDPDPPELGEARRYVDLLVPRLVDLLEQAAAAQPVLAVFEDAHNLDDLSVTLLREASALLRGKQVGFAAAIRDTEIEPGSAVSRWHADLLATGHQVVEVGPLTREDIRLWLSVVGATQPTAAAVKLAWERTGGNPLALRHVSLDPHDPFDDGLDGERQPGVTLQLRHALLSTLKRRSEACRDWLAAVAVTAVEQRFDPVFVARVARQSQRVADQSFDEARTAQIVMGRALARLSHDLWRDVILLDLSTTRARDLHARAFHALREHAEQTGDTSAETTLRLARYGLAGLAGHPQVAVGDVAQVALSAAQGARHRHAHESAIALCRRGLEIAEDGKLIFDLMLELADAQCEAGDVAGAEESYDKAGDRAVADDDGRLVALAALRLARIWWFPFRANPHLRDRLEAALEHLDPADVLLRAQLQAHLAYCLLTEGADLQLRTELSHVALDTLGQTESADPLTECEILAPARWALYESEPPSELVKLSQRLKRASVRGRSDYFQGEAWPVMVIDLLRLGRFQEARTEIEEHRQYAISSQRPLVLAWQRWFDVMMALWEGNFEQAEQFIGQADTELSETVQLLPPGSESLVRQILTAQFGWLLREQGQAELLMAQEEDILQIVREAGYAPMWRTALALLYSEAGNHEKAAEIVTAIAQEYDNFAAFPPHGWAVPALFVLAEVCDELQSGAAGSPQDGDVIETARNLRTHLELHLGEITMAGTPAVLIGPAAQAAGLAALVAGDANGAIGHFEDASRQTPPDAKPIHARLHFNRARAHLARRAPGDQAAAIHHLSKAIRLADTLGMLHLADKARSLKDRLQRMNG